MNFDVLPGIFQNPLATIMIAKCEELGQDYLVPTAQLLFGSCIGSLRTTDAPNNRRLHDGDKTPLLSHTAHYEVTPPTSPQGMDRFCLAIEGTSRVNETSSLITLVGDKQDNPCPNEEIESPLEELVDKLDELRIASNANFDASFEHVSLLEEEIIDVKSELRHQRELIRDQDRKIVSLEFASKVADDILNWITETLQTSLIDPAVYEQMKEDPAYVPFRRNKRLVKPISNFRNENLVENFSGKKREDVETKVFYCNVISREGLVYRPKPHKGNGTTMLGSAPPHVQSHSVRPGQPLPHGRGTGVRPQHPPPSGMYGYVPNGPMSLPYHGEASTMKTGPHDPMCDPWALPPVPYGTLLDPRALELHANDYNKTIHRNLPKPCLPHGGSLSVRPGACPPHSRETDPRSPSCTCCQPTTEPGQISIAPEPHDEHPSTPSKTFEPHDHGPVIRSKPIPPNGMAVDSLPGELCIFKRNGHFFRIISLDDKDSTTSKELLQKEDCVRVPPHEEFKRRSHEVPLTLDECLSGETTKDGCESRSQGIEKEKCESHKETSEEESEDQMSNHEESLEDPKKLEERMRVVEIRIRRILRRVEVGEAFVRGLSRDLTTSPVSLDTHNQFRVEWDKRIGNLSKLCRSRHKANSGGEMRLISRVDKLSGKLDRLASLVGKIQVQNGIGNMEKEKKGNPDGKGNSLQNPGKTGNLLNLPKGIGNLVPIKECEAVSYFSQDFDQAGNFRDKKAIPSFSEEIENPNSRSIEISSKMNYSDDGVSKSVEMSDSGSRYDRWPTRESRERRTTDDEESEDGEAGLLEESQDEEDIADWVSGRKRIVKQDPEDDFIDDYYGKPSKAKGEDEDEDSSEDSYQSPNPLPKDDSLDMEVISKKKWNSYERLKKGFKDVVSTIPRTMDFEEAWKKHALDFYLIDGETKKDVEDDFIDIRLDLYPPASSETLKGWVQEYDRRKGKRRCLYKIENPGRFLITIVIKGVEFKDVLCDTGSCVNIMSREACERINAKELKPSKIHIGMADATFTKPDGVLYDTMVEIGDCDVPVDFHVIKVSRKQASQIILGSPFLATAGVVMDFPSRKMILANIDKNVSYGIFPESVMERNRELTRERDREGEDVSSQPMRRRAKKACPETSSSSN